MKRIHAALVAMTLAFAAPALAQTAPARGEATLVLMKATAQIEVANDEAVVHFFAEAQDADLTRAQSLANQRVAEASAQLQRADPKALLETAGYWTHPIYSRDSGRRIVAWRVRQALTLRTTDLAALPKAVAAGQQHLAVGGVDFRLSRAAREKVDGELIRQAIANLNARIDAAARALEVPKARVRIDELNFGAGFDRPEIMPMARALAQGAEPVVEPHFDAGRSTQQLTLTAKIRFLRE
jgi:predicted secreted protein